MDSFAAVLPTLGYLIMYKMECELVSRVDVRCYNSEYECLWLTLFFTCRLKINHVSIGHMYLFLNTALSQTATTVSAAYRLLLAAKAKTATTIIGYLYCHSINICTPASIYSLLPHNKNRYRNCQLPFASIATTAIPQLPATHCSHSNIIYAQLPKPSFLQQY